MSGREFDLDVLEPAAGVPADRLAESLETAIAGRIVEESTRSIAHYSFAHALIRETIYERLSLTRRAQLHRQIGEAIEDLAGDLAGEQFGALAYHFSAAGDTAKAYRYHAAAADAAQRVYAVDAALSHYTAALKAATALGLEPVAEAAVRHLLLQRGRMRLRTGDPGALADLESVLDAARRCGDRASEMESLNELGILAAAVRRRRGGRIPSGGAGDRTGAGRHRRADERDGPAVRGLLAPARLRPSAGTWRARP